MLKVTALLVLSLISTQIFAVCPAPQKTVFHCTTPQKKQIQVCDTGTHLEYKYGKNLNAPEMILKVLRQQASTYQWAGIGPTETYTVNIPNANTTYSVFSVLDKNTFESSSGVSVYQNKQHKATIQCDQSQPITEDLFDIDLPASN